ncbi:MAG: hypothetical protein J5892_01690 [Bacilli bacterium]|nr:hypothetical protein [Bacilli bacterium]
MFQGLVGKRVNILVSTRGEMLLEYHGLLVEEKEDAIILENTEIRMMMLNFQKGIFGNNINRYKEDISRIVVNKKYVISIEAE